MEVASQNSRRFDVAPSEPMHSVGGVRCEVRICAHARTLIPVLRRVVGLGELASRGAVVCLCGLDPGRLGAVRRPGSWGGTIYVLVPT